MSADAYKAKLDTCPVCGSSRVRTVWQRGTHHGPPSFGMYEVDLFPVFRECMDCARPSAAFKED